MSPIRPLWHVSSPQDETCESRQAAWHATPRAPRAAKTHPPRREDPYGKAIPPRRLNCHAARRPRRHPGLRARRPPARGGRPLLERVAAAAAARRARRHRRARRRREPLPRHGRRRPQGGAGPAPRPAGRARRGGLRFLGAPPPTHPGDLPARRRGRLRVAQLRGLPDPRARRRRPTRRGAARRGAPPRPSRHGRRDRRGHEPRHRLQPQQPHRHDDLGPRVRGLPRPRAGVGDGRARRGVRRVRPLRRLAERAAPHRLPPQPRGASDLLEGLRARGASGGLRLRLRGDRRRARQGRHPLRGQRARPGRGAGGARRAGRAPG